MKPDSLSPSKETARAAFSQRLNALLDHYDVPPKHLGRQIRLKNDLSVSQETARKWLEGEAMPRHEKILVICAKYPCRTSWLEYGELPMRDDPETAELLRRWERYTDRQRAALLEILREHKET